MFARFMEIPQSILRFIQPASSPATSTPARKRVIPRSRELQAILALLFGWSILLGGALRIGLLVEKTLMEYDDALSYLTATGNAAEDLQIPASQWVSAETWQAFLEPKEGLNPVEIARFMSRRDAHPPLYDWLLFFWISLFGVQAWSGPLLNLFIDLLTTLVLYRFGRVMFNSPAAGMLVSATWLLSPVALKTALWTRNYALFALVTAFFCYRLYLFLRQPKQASPLTWDNLFLVLAIVVGLLTHFYFFLVLAAGGIMALVCALLSRRSFNLAMLTWMCFSVGGIAFIAIHPQFYYSIYGGLLYAQMTGEENIQQIGRMRETEFRLRFMAKGLLLLYSQALFAVATTAFFLNYRKFWDNLVRLAKRIRTRQVGPLDRGVDSFLVIGVAVLLTLAVGFLYLIRISPPHAMSARYLSFLAPLVAFIPLFIIRKTQIQNILVASTLVAMQIIGITAATSEAGRSYLDPSILRGEQVILLDNVARGAWPSILSHLDPQAQIYAAPQNELLSNPSAWIDRLVAKGGLYVSFVRGDYGSIPERREILELLKSRATLTLLANQRNEGEWSILIYRVSAD